MEQLKASFILDDSFYRNFKMHEKYSRVEIFVGIINILLNSYLSNRYHKTAEPSTITLYSCV